MDRVMMREYAAYMRRRGYAQGTIRTRMRVAGQWVRWCPTWQRADFRDVEGFIGEQTQMAARSKRNVRVALGGFYRWAQRQRLVDHDPTLLADLPRMPHLLPRPASEDHLAVVMAEVDDRVAAMIGLMAGAGLRCIEVAGLGWDDIDLARRQVRVFGKGQREREVTLSIDVVLLLAALDGTTGRVFTGLAGRSLTPARVSRIVCSAFRDRGFPETAHQLRHRAATVALAIEGADVYDVRDILGHASIKTTEGYTAVVPGRAARISSQITLPPRGRAA